jgi:hypothetical protein
MSASVANRPNTNEPKLLDQVRDVIRRKHYSIRTEQSYLEWLHLTLTAIAMVGLAIAWA